MRSLIFAMFLCRLVGRQPRFLWASAFSTQRPFPTMTRKLVPARRWMSEDGQQQQQQVQEKTPEEMERIKAEREARK